MFQRRYHKLNEEAADWYSMVWGDTLVRKTTRYIKALGFALASFVPHPEYCFEPVLVDLQQTDVYVRVSTLGKSDYRVFHRPSHGDMFGPASVLRRQEPREEILNIFALEVDQPDANGSLRSQIAVLSDDLLHEAHLMQCARLSEWSRANPALVTERVEEKYDPNYVPTASMTGGDYHGDGNSADNGRFSAQKQAMMHHEYSMARIMNSANATPFEELRKYMQKQMATRPSNLYQQVYIDPGRKLVNQQVAETPGDLIEFRRVRLERCLALFGIPISMMSNMSAKGGKKETGAGTSSNAQLIFLNAQKELKHQLLAFMKRVYNEMHDKENIAQYVAELDDEQKADWDEMEVMVDVDISLPGIPDDDTLFQMYTIGILKYDALVEYLSSRHGMPISKFNTKAELSILELNGMQEEVAEPPKKKAKS